MNPERFKLSKSISTKNTDGTWTSKSLTIELKLPGNVSDADFIGQCQAAEYLLDQVLGIGTQPEAKPAPHEEKPKHLQGTLQEISERILAEVPDQVRELITVTVEDQEHLRVKSNQYMGSENFAILRKALEPYGAEYISAGKDTHFRIHIPCGEQQKQKPSTTTSPMTLQEIEQFPWVASSWVRKGDEDRKARPKEDAWIREEEEPRLVQLIKEAGGKLEISPYMFEHKVKEGFDTGLIVRHGPKPKQY